MKKIISFVIAVVLCALPAFTLLSCDNGGKEETSGATTLYVYNWGEYISDGSEDSLDVNAAFEDYCRDVLGKNVKVNYSTYASNEDLYAKLLSGAVAYDVIIPSDYMIARLAAEGLLAELNPEENLPNYKYISDEFKNLYYDPDNVWSVPYTFGTVGVIYNTEMVDEEDIGSWDLMWNEKYAGNILQFNNPRDGFMTAQFLLGYSINSEDPTTWEEALGKLKDQKDVVQGYVMDEIFNKMKSGSAAISSYYAGDFFTMYDDNDALGFYYPEEGTNVFVDGICIPSCVQNYDLAVEYVNFMLSGEIAVANAEYICYASPNTLVTENEDYIECMEEIHPDAMNILYGFDSSKMEYYHDLPDDTRNLMNSLWEELKIESNIGTTIFVVCGVVVVALAVIIVAVVVRRKKRKEIYDEYDSENDTKD